MNSTFLQEAIARLLYASTRRTGETGNHFWEGMAMDIWGISTTRARWIREIIVGCFSRGERHI
jgi:hypothetical protein